MADRLKITAAFRFVVSLDGTAVAAFTECVLPTLELNVEEVKEGGLNTYVHQLPGAMKIGKITLKNGVGSSSSFQDWYSKTLRGEISRKRVSVSLLNSELETVMMLNLQDAYPSKWTGPQLKSDQNSVAIQTLELAFGDVSFGS